MKYSCMIFLRDLLETLVIYMKICIAKSQIYKLEQKQNAFFKHIPYLKDHRRIYGHTLTIKSSNI